MLIFVILLFSTVESVKHVLYTSNFPPICECKEDSTDITGMKGFSIEALLNIANTLGWEDNSYEIRCMNWDKMLEGVKRGDAVMAEAGINIWYDRLDDYNFSPPTYISGLTIVVKHKEVEYFWLFLEPFEWTTWVSLFGLTLVMSHLIWFLERSHHYDFPLRYGEGIIEAMYFTYTGLFFYRTKKIRTIPGRILMIGFWLACFIIFGAFLGGLISRLSLPTNQNKLKSENDLDGAVVGSFAQYNDTITSLGGILRAYEYEQQDIMVEDLKSGQVDGILLESPQAQYIAANDCELEVVGDIVLPIYYGVLFYKQADKELIKNVSAIVSKWYENNFQRDTMNKYMLETAEHNCSTNIQIPFQLYHIVGVLISISGGLVIGLITYLIYFKFFQHKEKRKVSKQEKEYILKKLETSRIEEDLLTKFSNILILTHEKICNKISEIQDKLDRNREATYELETNYRYLLEDIERMLNR
jgi:ABC-type amino acid transport substrate-binding protein